MLETDTENGVPVLRFSGRLDAAAAAATWQAAHRAAHGRFVVDARRVEAMDSAGAALLAGLGEGAEWREPEAEAPRLVLRRFRTGLERVTPPAPRKPLPWLAQIGAPFVARAGGLRERMRFLGETVLAGSTTALRPWRLRWREVVRHLDEAGTRAFPLCILLGVLIGVILAFQSSIPMRQFGAEIFIPQLVGISLARELGPLLASIVLAGRTASAYAAELGTMKVNEEVDAIRTMGLDPVVWLVLPRVVAAAMVMPVLALVMTVTGIVGMGIVMATLGYPPVAVAIQLKQWLSLGDVVGGLSKAAVFGLAIGYIGCRSGLSAGRGPRAVGDAATMAVVGGIVSLVVLDGVFAVLFFRLGW
ncbi:MlaE family ABC transporter permease [Sabulicella rubraurantiaca]|uniref:MlaE family ABC transporter permease n=1 Tax=Sabulicella rubraurantiaca TaxID=2811429 RepID=UPI001F47B8E1|nr:ABC transporter permease [Sabulicella rubraurantiaca]